MACLVTSAATIFGEPQRHRALLAFTLIELLVVISVIGLLAGLTVGSAE
jgi:prepilin-type N-terminal cleavage/methylation domain-containing protein